MTEKRSEGRGHWGIPGPGGSLGKCAICGDSFVAEVFLNKPVESFGVQGIEQTLYCHEKCRPLLEAAKNDWKMLPDGPLRIVFAEHAEKIATGDRTNG